MAARGDRACRSILGDALWIGSEPKHVVVRGNGGRGGLHAGCNLRKILTISSSTSSGSAMNSAIVPIVRLPHALAQLERLESLVLSGHEIASDGIPFRVLDGVTLPFLTRMEFGDTAPVQRALDLMGADAADIDTFPPYALRFMTKLESLRLGGSNISCFPPSSEFSRLPKLRKLDLSGTHISYLPPSVLTQHRQLEVNLSGTPVSRSLDWSDHGLATMALATSGLAEDDNSDSDDLLTFLWKRLTSTLPLLTSLVISGNGLTDARALNLSVLQHLRHLRSLDVSHNPALTPTASSSSSDGSKSELFSWWKVLSEHPTLANASFIGLANVGLGQVHMGLKGNNDTGIIFTCAQLRWVRRLVLTQGVNQGAIRYKQTCKMHRNSVWRFCHDTPWKIWGIGPEGQQQALENCEYATSAGRDDADGFCTPSFKKISVLTTHCG